MIVAFDADDGLKETFLSMDPVQEDYYDGSKKYDYGARYNTTATVTITVIKHDHTTFSVADIRDVLRWLTGSKTTSWLDMYADGKFQYSFFGRFTNVEQYKIDARTIGLTLTFSSIAPWAFSGVEYIEYTFGKQLTLNNDGVLSDSAAPLRVNSKGVLSRAVKVKDDFSFYPDSDGLLWIDNTAIIPIDNLTDDLYSYINLDVQFENKKGTSVFINNETLGEKTVISNIAPGENIRLSAGQFIVSMNKYGEIQDKIFGDDFNFVWPRLAPGMNEITVGGGGSATIKFSYRYPIKIGDCTMDIDISSVGANCDCSGSGYVSKAELVQMLSDILS